MIKIKKEIIRGISQCRHKTDLYGYLQNAIVLEHATIPPYLTALFSLEAGHNEAIAGLIRGVVIEEMLHVSIAANTLIAIGGKPQINNPEFIPRYPGPLPMGIGGDDFEVPIKAFSKDVVKDVFMVIEEPEEPITIDQYANLLASQPEPDFDTIGAFYTAVQHKITELGDGIFEVGPEQQMLKWFDAKRLFPIVDVKSAVSALEVIKIEGEGTSTDPFQSDKEPAHYYTFSEIYHGKKIVKNPDGGYSYSGAPIPFSPEGVYPMVDNPKIEDFEEGTQARIRIERYAYSYSSLLNALHKTFNGHPEQIDVVMGLMYELKLQAVSLMQTPSGQSGRTCGPSYQFVNTQGGIQFDQ